MTIFNWRVFIPLILLVIVQPSSSLPTSSRLNPNIPLTAISLKSEVDLNENQENGTIMEQTAESAGKLKPIATSTTKHIRVRYWAPTIEFQSPEVFDTLEKNYGLKTNDYWAMQLWLTDYLLEEEHTMQEQSTFALVNALLKGKADQVKRRQKELKGYEGELKTETERTDQLAMEENENLHQITYSSSYMYVGKWSYDEEGRQEDHFIQRRTCDNFFFFKVCKTFILSESQPLSFHYAQV